MTQSTVQLLSDDLVSRLQKEHFVLLATVDMDTSGPNVNAISWVHALNTSTIRFAVGHRSRILDNIRNNGGVNLTIFANETVYTIVGNAKVIADIIDGVTIKLAMVEILVEAVHEVMFYGAKIVQEPTYEKTMKEELAQRLDEQVLQALKA